MVQSGYCEVNWLDPEPSADDPGYESYKAAYDKEYGSTGRVRRVFDGLYEPPTQQAYMEKFGNTPRQHHMWAMGMTQEDEAENMGFW